jgi:hypothetical protein
MHLIDLSVNFLGCVPIVGSTIPRCPIRLYRKVLEDDGMTACQTCRSIASWRFTGAMASSRP